MKADMLKQAILFVVFVLAQVVVLGRIHLFHYATPLLYVYFVIMLPRNYPKWAVLLWSFLLGLVIDIFTNTPGLAAASLTLVAVVQPYFIELFVPRDSVENLVPSVATLGPTKYVYYAGALIVLYCMAFFSLEAFTFFNAVQWAASVGGSAALTMAFVLVLEYFKRNKRSE